MISKAHLKWQLVNAGAGYSFVVTDLISNTVTFRAPDEFITPHEAMAVARKIKDALIKQLNVDKFRPKLEVYETEKDIEVKVEIEHDVDQLPNHTKAIYVLDVYQKTETGKHYYMIYNGKEIIVETEDIYNSAAEAKAAGLIKLKSIATCVQLDGVSSLYTESVLKKPLHMMVPSFN